MRMTALLRRDPGLRIIIILIIIYAVLPPRLSAQKLQRLNYPDSIFISLGKPLRSLELEHLGSDTVVWIGKDLTPDTVDYIEPKFLSRIQNLSSRYRITRKVAEQFFLTENISDVKRLKRRSELYNSRDKSIAAIYVMHTDLLLMHQGSADSGMIAKFTKIVNSRHNYTNEKLIRQHLIIKEGDLINPDLILENERVIRTLPFIDECKILISTSGDGDPEKVDLIVLLKDRVSWNADIRLNNLDETIINLDILNLYGSGAGLNETIRIRTDKMPVSLGIRRSQFNAYNLGGLFLNTSLTDYNDGKLKLQRIRLNRLLTSDIFTYTGGFTYSVYDKIDSTGRILMEYDNRDIWLGRSISFKSISEALNSPKMIISGRSDRRKLRDSVFNPDELGGEQISRQDRLLNLAVSKRKYYFANYIYELGQTEDVPAGYLFNLTFGQRAWGDSSRYYGGMRYSCGEIFNGIGYLKYDLKLSAWHRKEEMIDGMLDSKIIFFSPLFMSRWLPTRVYWTFKYTRGFNRVGGQRLYLQNPLLPGAVDLSGRNGMERLVMSMEDVFYFRPKHNGIRSAFFVHADAAILSGGSSSIIGQKPIWGGALGYRIKHDYLAFNTIQLGISARWDEPGDYPVISFNLQANRDLPFDDFIIKKPEFMIFR